MKKFDTYRHPEHKGGTRGRTTFWGAREIEIVKNGFSWPGFFFGPVWALAKRLYPHAAVLLLIDIGLVVAVRDDVLAISGEVAVKVVVGLMGNAWRRQELSSHGFHLEESADPVTDGNRATERYSRAAGLIIACLVFIAVAGADRCAGMPPVRITGLIPQDSETAVYVAIDPARVDLPWTLERVQVRVGTVDATSIAASAVSMSLGSELALTFDDIVIQRFDSAPEYLISNGIRLPRVPDFTSGQLSFDLRGPGDSQPIEGLLVPTVRTIPEPTKPGEIAFLFPVPRDRIRTLSVTLANRQALELGMPWWSYFRARR